jgi:predicted phosphodiesterase
MLIKDFDFGVNKTGPMMNLYCIGDLHIGSPAFLERSFDALSDIVRKDKYAYFICPGDLTDDDRPTTRLLRRAMFNDRQEALEQEDIQHLTWMDNFVIPRLNKLMKPSRTLGFLDGDHYRVYANGLTSVQYICAKNKIPYLGSGQALLRLNFKYKTAGSATVKIHIHHGKGSGVTEASDINELQKVSNQWRAVDVFIRGHSHKPKFIPFQRYYDTKERPPEVRVREGFLINAGSFRQGVIMGKVDYAEREVYPPTSTRCPILHMIGSKPTTNNCSFMVDLSASLTVQL